MHCEPGQGDEKDISSGERSRPRTCESLDAEPEHGKDDSGYDAEIAEPEAEGRPVEDRERYVESGTDGPVEDDDESDDKVTESYRRQCLSPTTTSSLSPPNAEENATYQLRPIASIELASS